MFFGKKFVGVLRLSGVITYTKKSVLQINYNLFGFDYVRSILDKTFTNPKCLAIALEINSPGGSAAQSSLIYNYLRSKSDEHKKPVYAFVEDVAASGGYYIACGASKIFATPCSIVGSIGAIYAGFGLDELIKNWKITRRVITAGDKKLLMDPFQPEKQDDIKRIQELLNFIHKIFIDDVKISRGTRLNDSTNIFDGSIWCGKKAVDAGLIDGIGDIFSVCKTEFGQDVKFKTLKSRGIMSQLTDNSF